MRRLSLLALLAIFLLPAVSFTGCAAIIGVATLSSKVAATQSILDAALRTARRFAEVPDELPRITSGQAVEGTLALGDEELEDGSFFHTWFYDGTAGERLIVRMTSETFAPFVVIGFMEGGLEGRFVQLDGQGPLPDGSTARISIELERTGLYTILANSEEPGATGAYRLEMAAVAADDAARAQEQDS